jgi:hypothetical protein
MTVLEISLAIALNVKQSFSMGQKFYAYVYIQEKSKHTAYKIPGRITNNYSQIEAT